jgi:hypothetical protein
MLGEEKKRAKESRDYEEEEPKFTSHQGRKYEFLGSGWTKEGKVFYDKMWREWKDMFKNEEFWTMLEVAWDTYKSENGIAKMWQKR